MNLLHSISSILNSHFLLALHKMNTQLQGAANAPISSLTLETGSHGEPMAGSPKLPEFLDVIGGSIHSFHNDEDEDLTLPPGEEQQSEIEEDIQVA